MGDESRFTKLVNRAPIDNDKLIGQAVSWFIKKQNPDEVDFTAYENGYEIKVFSDEEASEEAKDFWEEYVYPHLGGEE